MITKARKWIMVASLMLTMCFAINNSTSAKAAVVTEVATQNLKPESVKLSYFLQELLRIDVIHCFTPYQGTQFLFVV